MLTSHSLLQSPEAEWKPQPNIPIHKINNTYRAVRKFHLFYLNLAENLSFSGPNISPGSSSPVPPLQIPIK